MAFWRTWSWDASAIDSLLDNENITLEQILNENDILNEAKSQNKKLIEFFIKEEQLETLLSYVLEEHNDLSEEEKYKYPYIVCEILCTDIFTMYETIFSTKEILSKFFDFWTQTGPLNHLLAGYNNRIIGCFLSKRKGHIINFIKEKDNYLNLLLNNIDDTNVVEFILKLIASDDPDVPTINWLIESNLIPNIIDKYQTNHSDIVHENISQLLSGIIVISEQNASVGGDCSMLNELQSEEVVSVLIKHVLSGPQASSLLHGSSVIVELMRQTTSDIYDFETSINDIPPIIRILASYAGKINGFLQVSPNEERNTSFGTLSPPLGMHRIKAIELISAVVSTRYVCVYNTILESSLVKTLIDLFFQYHWNNFLHILVSRIFIVLLESNDSDICLNLLEKTKLHCELAKVGRDDINSFNNDGYQRRGYMGFVTSLTTVLQNTSQVIEEVNQILEETEEWETFINGNYANTKEIEGAVTVYNQSSEDEESEPLTPFQHIRKQDFENEFPDNFSIGDFEDQCIDNLMHPIGSNFIGIPCEETGFGEEFDSDDE